MNFSERNRRRCESPEGFNHKLESWSMSDWFTALVGEVGEAGNIIKKLNRIRDGVIGNDRNVTKEILEHDLLNELADVYIYLDLFVQLLGVDLLKIAEEKFQITSCKIGYKEDEELLKSVE